MHKRTVELSAINEREDAALETVMRAIEEERHEDEFFRYTNKFKKEIAA